MRLVTFEMLKSVGRRAGVLNEAGTAVHDLSTRWADMRSLLEDVFDGTKDGDSVIKEVTASDSSKLYQMEEVRLLAPLYNPEKILCIGMNYADHCHEQNFPIPTEPIIFSKFASTIIAPGENIILDETEELDFEVELAVIIGKKGKKISKENAYSHVAGYATAHDVSARDWQLKKNGGQWLIGKTFDTFAPYGPAIVTKDEVGDVNNLGIRCFLNGESVQDSSTKELIFKVDDCIAWISRFMTLNPGDIIFTGTPPGVGCFRKPNPLWLKDGDVVKCEIDKLGSIENKVVKA